MSDNPAAPDTSSAGLEEWRALVRQFEGRGMLLRAYDAALRALAEHPGDPWLQHRAVLALGRAGATETAIARYGEYKLAGADDDEDIAALGARLKKDLVWLVRGEERIHHAGAAAQAYGRVHARTGGYFPGINAATMQLIAGEPGVARDLARAILGELEHLPPADGEQGYYRAATQAEALLLCGDGDGARKALRRAVALSGDLAARATTRKQLRRVCRALGLDTGLLDELAAWRVIHFTGHMIAAPGVAGRFPATGEDSAAARIAAYLDRNDAGFGYGSLACGADTLFAEALLERGGELNIVLPFRFDEFLDISVRRAGSGWEDRVRLCLGRAATVTYATEDSYLGDDALFAYASRLAMGLAVLRGRYLDAVVEQVALWDGVAAKGAAGTAADVTLWRGLDHPQTILPCPDDGAAAPPESPPSLPSAGRANCAMLFGDIKGFSKLDDRQLPVFVRDVLGAMANVLKGYAGPLRFRNTWGDGIYLVFDDPHAAARCALELQVAVSALPLAELGLPGHIALRLGGHFGPVYEDIDPIVGGTNFFGAHVSRAARIEPITPEGCVYVTEHFAAALALDARGAFSCDYVGTVPAAKGYGDLAMYLLRRSMA
ncbi:MAG: hypothetical protein CFH40_00401 [Alphaproteobacteria bacterium MarineAlpha10_Bin3]|nr:MAG: hypothetical protein CFH40_00401 [Alphaproteobacteria bacterium MarineAlpha10_Bin3]PPR74940.1 MAG: hypothetical protein CFH09_00401 [Alphaproteobacteria bacterium MarineAlpha4_Bin1]